MESPNNSTNTRNLATSDSIDDTNLTLPHLVSVDDEHFTMVINTYVAPPVILFTLLTNTTICFILLRKSMRSPTNILLVFIAVSDMITGILPLPNYIYFYLLGHYTDWVPYTWCYFFLVSSDTIPTLFHTASIWLTVVLAVQRYFYICKPGSSKGWCTVPNAIKVGISIYILSFFSQLSRYLEINLSPSEGASKLDPNINVSQCWQDIHEPFKSHMTLYYNTIFSLRVVMVHLVPCFMLVVLTSLLVKMLKDVQRRKEQLLKQSRRTECRRMAESNMTTLMLVAVVAVFLAVELPLAFLFIIMMLDNSFDLEVISPHNKELAQSVINLSILLSYPFNFFIYCTMSKTFRSVIADLLLWLCCCKKNDTSNNETTVSIKKTRNLKVHTSNSNNGGNNDNTKNKLLQRFFRWKVRKNGVTELEVLNVEEVEVDGREPEKEERNMEEVRIGEDVLKKTNTCENSTVCIELAA